MATSSGARAGPKFQALPSIGAVTSVFAAGFAATVVFTLFMWYAGKAIAGFPMDVSQVLATFLGENPMLGTTVHYLTGTIAYPVGYLVVRRFLPGSPMAKGLIYGVLLWLVANLVLLPSIGTGIFMTGFFEGSALIAPQITSLAGHVIFGLILGVLAAWLTVTAERG